MSVSRRIYGCSRFAPSETPSEDFSESTECVTYGRLVVDRKEENILFVREINLDLTTKHLKNFECFIWRKGIETAFSKNGPSPNTRMCDFIRFNAFRQIPIVELTQSSFPCTLAKERKRTLRKSTILPLAYTMKVNAFAIRSCPFYRSW